MRVGSSAVIRAFDISDRIPIRIAYKDGCRLNNLQVNNPSKMTEKHERNERIVRLRQEGWTKQAIAELFGLSEGAVHSLLKKYGDPQDRPVERITDIDTSALSKTERNALMVNLRLKSYTFQEIGNLFGISRQAAQQIISRELKRDSPEKT